ncbi:S41 family peptidase [Cohnella sp. LGH]|uniref:Carboxyl-terminal processing protease n=1 Tax=Cohnella phaseoli TaxID=456490 RepID=A0A3D9JV88_9BACL|nr:MULTISPECIES: S41 family peptidase [Cohnella]QTH45072.1 S41 family peptidase [Cohnella sp. LGH]RED77457.1 carboxyl-terminal processing protease [Cohnella phaseoli]
MNLNWVRKIKHSVVLLLTFSLFFVYIPAALGATAQQTEEVRELLEQYHLKNPQDTDLANKEIDEMVDSLNDPYTEYFDDDEWSAYSSELEQTFVGIGIVMREDKGGVYVEDVIAESPASSVGILAGDLLVSADGKSFKGKSMADIQKEIRGEEGTSVALTVSRSGKSLKFKITRKSVHVPVVSTKMLDQGIGYLALSSFTSEAGKEVKRELEKLEKNGLSSLVLDLRNNGGGYVVAAQEIAGLFVEKGVLAHMRDRTGHDEPLSISGTKRPYEVVILVNGNTASASELLSGALRDYGVAQLVGAKTYGKGVVQSLMPLSSGGVLKVTIQEYYTPKGKKVDQVGLAPDLALSGAAEQLIGAFRLAGGKKLAASWQNGILTVNGIRMSQPDAARKEQNLWYVNLKLGAEIAGAKLSYDAKNRTYTLAKGNQKETIKQGDSRILIKDGRTSLDVRLLAKWFKGVTFSTSGDTLKLGSR